jgi:hypothetical protein
MSIAKGLAVKEKKAVEDADRDSRFLAESALPHFYKARVRTLTSLIDEVDAPLAFDLLSLDVKGNELAVFRGLICRGTSRNESWWKQEVSRLPKAFLRLPIMCILSVRIIMLTPIFFLPAISFFMAWEVDSFPVCISTASALLLIDLFMAFLIHILD